MPKISEWMSGGFGLMIHYLPGLMESRSGELFSDVDACTNSFNVPEFLDRLEEIGADWLIFTFGQNTGLYNSPNSALDSLTGPGHCSKRDLAGELADGMKKRGKRFIAYLPIEAAVNRTIQKQLGWIPVPNDEMPTRQLVFQENWRNVIREWSLRFGERIDGWWFDGAGSLSCTPADRGALFDAARIGNPNAALSMNYSGFDMWDAALTAPGENYFSGEATLLKNGLPLANWRERTPASKKNMGLPMDCGVPTHTPFRPNSAYLRYPDVLMHALVPIDCYWARKCSVEWFAWESESRYMRHPETLAPGQMEPPMYSADELRVLLDTFCSCGAAVTLNAGVFADGTFGEESFKILKQVKK